MALSGTFYTNVGSNWRLQLEWSATQSVANNTSTITTKLYWMGLNSYGTTYSTATKDGSSTIDGSASSFSGGSLAKLSGSEKKLIKTHSKTVTHNSDGAKSVALSAYFDVELNLGGTYYGRVNVSGTASLNTIPRASSLTDATPNWTAGGSLSLGISRASSSFTHTAKISVDGVLVKTVTGITTGTTVSFTTAENTTIFNELAQGSSKTATVELITYNGSTTIGSKTFTGSVSAPARSLTSWSGDFDIGTVISGSVTRTNSAFTHTIQLIFGSTVFTLINKGTAIDWSYDTSAIASALYALTPNSDSLTGKIRIYTYYNTAQVGNIAESTITAYATASDLNFSASQITYADTNAITKALTGDASYIIQNQSDLTVTLNSLATASNSATIVGYDVTINGVTKTLTTTGSLSFGKINASTNLTMLVRVKDSRGNYKEVTKTINMIEYKPVAITANAKRVNNYEDTTNITLSGSVSLLPVGATPVNKNALIPTTGLQYRYKESTSSTWGAWTNFVWTTSGANYTATTVTRVLDNTKSYNFEFKATDKLGSYTTARTVSAGSPIFFIDSEKKSVGIGKFPTKSNSLEIAGTLELNTLSATDVNATNVTAPNVKSDKLIVGKDTVYPATIEQIGQETRIGNGDYYVSFEPVNSSYAEIQTNSALIDFMSPVRFYSGDVDVRNSLKVEGNVILGSTGGIYSSNSNDHVLRDHGNGNVTLGATGQYLFLGYNNTSEIIASTQFRPIASGEISGWANGWKSYSSGASGFTARYTKTVEGMVTLQGLMNGTGTMATGNGTRAFQLPVGCRPSQTILAYVNGYGGRIHRLNILADGYVNIIKEGVDDFNQWVCLNGVSFQALQ